MDKNKIQGLIPRAIEAIQKVGISDDNYKVDKVHEGYVNALGPNIIQSGVLPTLIYYNKQGKDNVAAARSLWLKALYYMEFGEIPERPTALIAKIIEGKENKLGEIKLGEISGGIDKEWKDKLLEYVVVLKLAFRTYEIKEIEEGGDEA